MSQINYSLEDTHDKSYRDVNEELKKFGWKKVNYRKRSKLEKKRFPPKEAPLLVWTLNEKGIDFNDLSREQICNHYEGIHNLTTKRGFCELLRELHWDSVDASDVAPRCYYLGDPMQREEFIDDFRLIAATNILRWFVLHSENYELPLTSVSSSSGFGSRAGSGSACLLDTGVGLSSIHVKSASAASAGGGGGEHSRRRHCVCCCTVPSYSKKTWREKTRNGNGASSVALQAGGSTRSSNTGSNNMLNRTDSSYLHQTLPITGEEYDIRSGSSSARTTESGPSWNSVDGDRSGNSSDRNGDSCGGGGGGGRLLTSFRRMFQKSVTRPTPKHDTESNTNTTLVASEGYSASSSASTPTSVCAPPNPLPPPGPTAAVSGKNDHASGGSGRNTSRRSSRSENTDSTRSSAKQPLPNTSTSDNVSGSQGSKSGASGHIPASLDRRMVHLAMTACLWHIRLRLHGEFPGVDISPRYFRDRDTSLQERQWCELLDCSYDLAELPCTFSADDAYDCCVPPPMPTSPLLTPCPSTDAGVGTGASQTARKAFQSPRLAAVFDPLLLKVQSILGCMARINRQQFLLDGFRNIWVVKAAESSCGRGIRPHCNLDEILQSERGMGGRTVQKYAERPLLVRPITSTATSTSGSTSTGEAVAAVAGLPSFPSGRLSTGPGPGQEMLGQGRPPAVGVKFDLRVWCLVTSLRPLRAHVYAQTYGRKCLVPYSTQITALGDSYAHLTNYSIQKKGLVENIESAPSNSGGGGNGSRNGSGSFRRNYNNKTTSGNTISRSAAASDSGDDYSSCNDQSAATGFAAAGGAASSNAAPSSVSHRLREVCHSFRDDCAQDSLAEDGSHNSAGQGSQPAEHSARTALGESGSQGGQQQQQQQRQDGREAELLMSHSEIIDAVTAEYHKLLASAHWSSSARAAVTRIGPLSRPENLWEESIWPSIKQSIYSTLCSVAKDSLRNRANSFEFLGYDVLLDESLVPWLLEVNMSPAMAHRSPEQSRLIADMSHGLVQLAIVPKLAPQQQQHLSGIRGQGSSVSKQRGGAVGLWEPLSAQPSTGTNHTGGSGNGTSTSKGGEMSTSSQSDTEPDGADGDYEDDEGAEGASIPEDATPFGLDIDDADNDNVDIAGARVVGSLQDDWALPAPEFDHTSATTSYSGGGTSRVRSVGEKQAATPAATRAAGVGGALAMVGASGLLRVGATVTTASTGSAGGRGGGGDGADFVVQARAISRASIEFNDDLLRGWGAMRLLQRWWRRYLQRLRCYHHLRFCSSRTIQTTIRRILACRVALRLRRHRSAVRIQTCSRMRQAAAYLRFLRHTQASISIQRIARGRRGKRLFQERFIEVNISKIQSWYGAQKQRYCLKCAGILVRLLRIWLFMRRQCIYKVFHACRYNLLRRRRRATLIQRSYREYVVRSRFLASLRKLQLKKLSNLAAAQAMVRLEQLFQAKALAQEQRECAEMECSEAESRAFCAQDDAERLVWAALVAEVLPPAVCAVVEDVILTGHINEFVETVVTSTGQAPTPKASSASFASSASPASALFSAAKDKPVPTATDCVETITTGAEATSAKGLVAPPSEFDVAEGVEAFLSMQFTRSRPRRVSASARATTAATAGHDDGGSRSGGGIEGGGAGGSGASGAGAGADYVSRDGNALVGGDLFESTAMLYSLRDDGIDANIRYADDLPQQKHMVGVSPTASTSVGNRTMGPSHSAAMIMTSDGNDGHTARFGSSQFRSEDVEIQNQLPPHLFEGGSGRIPRPAVSANATTATATDKSAIITTRRSERECDIGDGIVLQNSELEAESQLQYQEALKYFTAPTEFSGSEQNHSRHHQHNNHYHHHHHHHRKSSSGSGREKKKKKIMMKGPKTPSTPAGKSIAPSGGVTSNISGAADTTYDSDKQQRLRSKSFTPTISTTTNSAEVVAAAAAVASAAVDQSCNDAQRSSRPSRQARKNISTGRTTSNKASTFASDDCCIESAAVPNEFGEFLLSFSGLNRATATAPEFSSGGLTARSGGGSGVRNGVRGGVKDDNEVVRSASRARRRARQAERLLLLAHNQAASKVPSHAAGASSSSSSHLTGKGAGAGAGAGPGAVRGGRRIAAAVAYAGDILAAADFFDGKATATAADDSGLHSPSDFSDNDAVINELMPLQDNAVLGSGEFGHTRGLNDVGDDDEVGTIQYCSTHPSSQQLTQLTHARQCGRQNVQSDPHRRYVGICSSTPASEEHMDLPTAAQPGSVSPGFDERVIEASLRHVDALLQRQHAYSHLPSAAFPAVTVESGSVVPAGSTAASSEGAPTLTTSADGGNLIVATIATARAEKYGDDDFCRSAKSVGGGSVVSNCFVPTNPFLHSTTTTTPPTPHSTTASTAAAATAAGRSRRHGDAINELHALVDAVDLDGNTTRPSAGWDHDGDRARGGGPSAVQGIRATAEADAIFNKYIGASNAPAAGAVDPAGAAHIGAASVGTGNWTRLDTQKLQHHHQQQEGGLSLCCSPEQSTSASESGPLRSGQRSGSVNEGPVYNDLLPLPDEAAHGLYPMRSVTASTTTTSAHSDRSRTVSSGSGSSKKKHLQQHKQQQCSAQRKPKQEPQRQTSFLGKSMNVTMLQTLQAAATGQYNTTFTEFSPYYMGDQVGTFSTAAVGTGNTSGPDFFERLLTGEFQPYYGANEKAEKRPKPQIKSKYAPSQGRNAYFNKRK